ncbi:MAG: cytochrome c biogenesis protein ResB [Candidatus Brocadiaceae bacterium]|nr:cytochrome c biogenesis protein ResB [Candidatus Brocadiaceae bacterium]
MDRRPVQAVELGGVASLAALCVVGAFLGPERARRLFNSWPMGAFWSAGALWLLGRAVVGRGVARRVALLGAAFILAGGLWGSASGRRLAERLLGWPAPVDGYLFLPRGRLCDDVFSHGFEHRIARLPFHLVCHTVRVDADPAGGAVREYAADVAVVSGGRDVCRASVAMNRPLRHGGYQFSLQGGGWERGDYVMLRAKSDRGLFAVYAGMLLLCTGVFLHFWLLPAPSGGGGGADGP